MVVIMAGLAFGMVSRFFMPFILSPEQIGVLSLVDSVSKLLSGFATFGFAQIARRMYPSFAKSKGEGGFLTFGIILTFIGGVTALSVFYFMRDFILGESLNNQLLGAFVLFFMPVIFFRTIFSNMDAYVLMRLRSVIGPFMESFVVKVIVLLSLVSYYFGALDYNNLVMVYTLAFCLPGVVLLIVALMEGRGNMRLNAQLMREKRSDLWSNGIFGLLAFFSSGIILSIDSIMIGNIMNDLDAVGYYSILFFAGILVSVPVRGIRRIMLPVVSNSWESGDMENINSLYGRSHKIQLIIGGFLLIVGWACIDHALTYIPDYAPFVLVFLFIGIGQLVEMGTGVSNEIISTSEKFKWGTYLNVLLALILTTSNYFLITSHGIVGAACASMLSMVSINIVRTILIKRWYGLQPFDSGSLKILILLVLCMFAASYWKLDFHPVQNMLIYLVSFGTIYWGSVFLFGLSPDLKDLASKVLSGLVKRRG